MPDERTGREIELGRRPAEGLGPGNIELGRRSAEGPGPGDTELGRRRRIPEGFEPVGREVDPASGLPQRVRCERDGAEMVLVPAGEFIRGTSDEQTAYLARNLRVSREWMNDEHPQQRVTLDAYYIDIYPVTNVQYGKFLTWILQSKDHSRCHPSEPRGKDHTARLWYYPGRHGPQQPVVGVDWWDAYAYAAWAGKRLPTEAEWEKAARGTDGRIWPWGNQWDKAKCNTADGGPGVPTPVGRYPQGVSPYGCYDMAGNVWEWCADWFAEDYYQRGPLRNPTGPERGTVRVLRGGSWIFEPRFARCTYRVGYDPAWYIYRGFRCASPPQ